MKKTKVLHYIDSLDPGGAETIVMNYALLIDRQQIDMTIVCHDRKGTPYEAILSSAGVRVIYMSDYLHLKKLCKHYIVRRYFHKSGLDKYILRHIFHKEKPDIIHTHLRCNEIIKFAVDGTDCKILHTVHSQPSAYWNNKTAIAQNDFKACTYLVEKKHMQLIALHDGMRQELNELFHVNDTLVFNNGVNFDKFKISETKESIRNSLGIPNSKFVVGHVGRFVPVKNHDLIIESFKKLSELRDNAHLLLVGQGPLRPAIEKKIEEYGLKENVTILDPRNDIPRILRAMDVFLLPSLWEGLGIVLVESQTMGIYSIASSNVPADTVFSNLVLRMPPDADAAAWAKAIHSAPQLTPEYHGIENWNMKKIVKDLEALYQNSALERIAK